MSVRSPGTGSTQVVPLLYTTMHIANFGGRRINIFTVFSIQFFTGVTQPLVLQSRRHCCTFPPHTQIFFTMKTATHARLGLTWRRYGDACLQSDGPCECVQSTEAGDARSRLYTTAGGASLSHAASRVGFQHPHPRPRPLRKATRPQSRPDASKQTVDASVGRRPHVSEVACARLGQPHNELRF